MKFPLSWLKNYISVDLSPEELAETLTLIGLEVESVEKTDSDFLFAISLTPNLSHCLGLIGIARELAAVTEEKVMLPTFSLQEACTDNVDTLTSVTIEERELCPRYACRVIKEVKVGPSPDWLKEKIEGAGFRSVNNVVDITNYVLLEYGHPLHAFDYDKLVENRIVVRRAKKGEKLVTLDGKEHYPTEQTLLICDAKKPIAIAGAMGSLETEVTEKTQTVLLESAYFEPTQVRRTSKGMGIFSEASRRFERGTDPNIIPTALDRAAALLEEVALGQVARGTIDVQARAFPEEEVSCRLGRVHRILGTKLAMSEVETIFKRLGFSIKSSKQETIVVRVPTYRTDIQQEIDLIEEVARLYGYGNLHQDREVVYKGSKLPHDPAFLFEKRLRERLRAEGLQELLTCNLISPEQAELIAPDGLPRRSLITLLNPSSIEQSVLRPSLLPNMLQVVKYNVDHEIQSISGFEVGRIHFKSKDTYLEPTVASIVLTGNRAPYHWEEKERPVDFFDLKGIVENLVTSFHIETLSFEPSTYENFHPKRQARILLEGHEVGILGEIHPLTLRKMSLKEPLFFAELNVEDLRAAARDTIKMTPLPAFPPSVWDWTVTAFEECPVGRILSVIEKQETPLLEEIYLLDVYHSEKLGSDRKNVTFRFVYRDREKTLSHQVVEAEHERIIQTTAKCLKEEKNIP